MTKQYPEEQRAYLNVRVPKHRDRKSTSLDVKVMRLKIILYTAKSRRKSKERERIKT